MSERSIFMEALDLSDQEDQQAHLLSACGDDERLRARVEALLRSHKAANGFVLDRMPDVDIAGTVDMPPPLEEPGTVIGPYKILEQIGEGGMGAVYLAEQTRPVRRRVALKVIKPGMDTRQILARFEAERQALAMMDHPNIAKVLDAGATDTGRPYFVMELVKGIPITEYCDRERLPVRERLDLFVLVCRAVQHAHQKGIIHRDLKPSNVLVTVIDGVAVPKVIDFGVAKATGASLTERTLYTGFDQLIGTPLYMSPEQADVSGVDVDTRSDIYALGVVLYELLTGTTPFDRETFRTAALDEMRRIIREEEPPKPSTRLSSLGETISTVSSRRGSDPRHLRRAVRGELDWVVMRALEKDRRRRYETANDFAADVMRYLTDRPVEACPPSTLYRFTKYARRNCAALMTAALFCLALGIGTGISVWQAVRATQAEAEAGTRAEETRLVLDYLVEDVFGSARPEKARGRTLTVNELLARGEKAISDRFARRPLVEATARQAMGAVFYSLKRPEEAQRQCRRVADIRARLLGREHPDTLTAEGLLVDAVADEGWLHFRVKPELEPLARRVLDARARVLGPEHPATLLSMTALANALRLFGKQVEALDLLERACALQSRVFGPEDNTTLESMANRAAVLLDLGRLDESEAVFRQVLDTRLRILGPEDEHTHKSRAHLATTLHLAGRLDEAIPLQREAFAGLTRIFGPHNSITTNSLSGLVLLLRMKAEPAALRELGEHWLRECLAAPPEIDSTNRSKLSLRMGRVVLMVVTLPEPNPFDAALAVRAAEECVALDRDASFALIVRGVVFYRLGRLDDAMREMRTVIEQPAWKTVDKFEFLVLALIHARRGEMALARAWYDKVRNRPDRVAPGQDEVQSLRCLRNEAESVLGGEGPQGL